MLKTILAKFRPCKTPASQATALSKMIDDGYSTNMEKRIDQFQTIPGMLTRERGIILYSLAMGQTIPGDIVEIGSWQGRSTCFLAQACKDSQNGIVRAIDHFQGNAHSKTHYVVGKEDLSDLSVNFRNNITQAHLDDHVRLYEMSSKQAVAEHQDDFRNLRMLFIDGDHSRDAVKFDIEQFTPFIQDGGLIVFDDYHKDGAGVVQAVRESIYDTQDFDSFTQFNGFLIARKRKDGMNLSAQAA